MTLIQKVKVFPVYKTLHDFKCSKFKSLGHKLAKYLILSWHVNNFEDPAKTLVTQLYLLLT